MASVTLLKSFAYRVASNERSIYKSEFLAKTEWFKFDRSAKQSLIEMFVDDFVGGLAKLNSAKLTYEFNGSVILSASFRYVTSMQIEVKTPSFSIVVRDDADNMRQSLLLEMEADEKTQRQIDIDSYIEQLRS